MSIQNAILISNYDTALREIQSAIVKHKFKEDQALSILSSLSKKCSSKDPIPCGDVFNLADICCKTLEKKWNCSIGTFVRTLYYIIIRFIEEKEGQLSRKLINYLIKSGLSPKCNGDISNICHNISLSIWKYVFETKEKVKFFTGDGSYFTWWSTTLKLLEVSGYKNISTILSMYTKLLQIAQDSPDPESRRFVNEMLNSLSECLSRKGSLQLAEISSLCSVLRNYLIYMINLKENNFNVITDFMRSVTESCHCSDVENYFKPLLHLMECFTKPKNGISNLLSNFLRFLTKYTYSDSELSNFIVQAVYELGKILKLQKMESDELEIFIKIGYTLGNSKDSKGLTKYSTETGKVRAKLLVLPLFAAMEIIPACNKEQLELKQFFNWVYSIVDAFFKVPLEESTNNFNYGVFCCVNIIEAYRKNSLISHGFALSKHAIKLMLEVGHAVPSSKADLLITKFIDICCEGNWHNEALACILAIAGSNTLLVQKPFKHWCLIKEKVAKCDALTVDEFIIINESMNETLSSDVWPFSDIKHLDVEKFLFHEIRSYAEAKNLKNSTPALAAYKKAVKLVKDSDVLAKILCCAVDALTSIPDNQINMSNFETSIANMIKIIKKQGKSCKHLILGDLYYMLARCELSTLRKFAQIENESTESIPVIDSSEVDPDVTTIEVSKNMISVSRLTKLMDSLKVAITYWKRGLSEETDFDLDCETLSYIKGAAYLYRLLKYSVLEAEAWNALYDLAKKLKSEKDAIIAVSELLVCKLDVEESKLTEVKNLVSSSLHVDTYYHYHFTLSLARNHFNNSKFEEALDTLSDLPKEKLKYSLFSMSMWYLIDFLASNTLESKLPIEKSRESLKFSYSYAFSAINKKNVSFNESCMIQSLAFEVCIVVARTLCYEQCINSVNAYCKSFLKLASRLVVPIRRCELLYECAMSDVISANQTGLENKIQDIESILEVSPFRSPSAESLSRERKLYEKNRREEELLVIMGLHSLWGRYHQLDKKYQESVLIFIEGMYLAKSASKSVSVEMLSSFVEHEIHLYLNASIALISWKKFSKAQNYLNHALSLYCITMKKKDKILHSFIQTVLMCSMMHQPNSDFTLDAMPNSNNIADEDKENICLTPVNNSTKHTEPPALGKKVGTSVKTKLPTATPSHIHKNISCALDGISKLTINGDKAPPKIVVSHADDFDSCPETVTVRRRKKNHPSDASPKKLNVFCDSSPPATGRKPKKKQLNFLSPKIAITANISDDSDISVIESSPVIPVHKVTKTYKKRALKLRPK